MQWIVVWRQLGFWDSTLSLVSTFWCLILVIIFESFWFSSVQYLFGNCFPKYSLESELLFCLYYTGYMGDIACVDLLVCSLQSGVRRLSKPILSLAILHKAIFFLKDCTEEGCGPLVGLKERWLWTINMKHLVCYCKPLKSQVTRHEKFHWS